MGTLLIALFGLVVEDLLPNRTGATFEGERLLVTGGVAALLILLLWLRQRRTRFRGTLYYVRFLDAWMSDPHLAVYRNARGAHRDTRVVARWMSTPPRPDGGLDVADELAELSRDLQTTMNGDDASTGFNLAPNLLYPMAMALGYDLYQWPDSTLEEARVRGSRTPGLSWRVDDQPPSSVEARPVEEHTEYLKAAVDACHVVVRFTPEPWVDSLPWPAAHRVDIGVRHQTEKPNWDRVGVAAKPPNPGRPSDTPAMQRLTTIHPVLATQFVVERLQDLLHKHDNAPILLLMRAPKTVSLAVGHRLAQSSPRCTEHESCIRPWRRLIPILHEQAGNPPRLLICRVHRGQPCIAILTRRATYGQIDLAFEKSHRASCACPGGRN